jgi:choloylglycine hydrolase
MYDFVSIGLYATDLFPNGQFDDGVFGAGDGINEHGLTVSQQTARLSVYEDSEPTVGTGSITNICFNDVTAWLLGNFITVKQIKEALKEGPSQSARVVKASGTGPISGYSSQAENFYHWTIDDTEDHIVVEYRNGKLQLYDNNVGILTNDPWYDWHIYNLNNYVNINPLWADVGGVDIKIDSGIDIGTVPKAIGHGSNLLGLPGDYTPGSRFVKLFYLRQIAVSNSRPQRLDESIALVNGLLNTVFIPRGIISNERIENKAYETTNYSVIKLPQKRQFYYKDYNNQQWRLIDLTRLDFSEFIAHPLEDGALGVKDVTDTINEGGKPRNVPTTISPSHSLSPPSSKAMKRNERTRQKKEGDNVFST